MAIARTTFSLSDIAERWTRLYGEQWTESAVLQEAKAGRLLVGIELPSFQGIVGHPVDSIETQGQLDMLLIGAVKETGKDYVMPDKEQSTFAGFFWIRNYTALLGIELGESLRCVIEQERVLINHHCAVRPIIESVKDIMTSPQNITVRLQELEKFEHEHGTWQPAPPVVAAKDTEPVPTPEAEPKTDRLIQRRVEIIAAELAKSHQNLLALPYKTKVKLMHRLLSEMPDVFTSEPTFNAAWTDGSKAGRFGMAGKEKFKPRDEM